MMINLSPKYKPLINNDDRFFLITGGRGSGKSFSVCCYLLMLLLFEKGHNILFTRYTLVSAHISIIPQFTSIIDKLNLNHLFEITKDSILCYSTGSKIMFKGLKTSSGEQTANLKSLVANIWVLDEAEELYSEELFDKINLSLRTKDKSNKVILILNPASKNHWIYKRWFLKNNVLEGSNYSHNGVTYIHTTYLDNIKNLSDSFIQTAHQLQINDERKYNAIMMGSWLDIAEGIIFTDYKLIDDIPPEAELVGYGQDSGYNDPSAVVRIYKYNGELILDEMLYERLLTPSQLAEKIKALNLDNRYWLYCDSAAPGYIQEMRNKGISAKGVKKGPDSILIGINILLDYKLNITSSSKNLINELNNYVWEKNNNDEKKDKPIDKFNHLIDCARYVALMKLGKSSSQPMLSF